MIVDVWAQITTERMARAAWLATLLRWTGRSETFFLPTRDSTLAAMDASEVDIALLSAWYGPEGPLITNEEVAAQVDAAPMRFRGLASADLRDPMGAVREIRRWVGAKGFVGFRFVPWLWCFFPYVSGYYQDFAVVLWF